MYWFSFGKHTSRNSLARLTADTISPVHLSAMADPQYQDDQFIVLDVVDNSVVADANAKFTVSSLELDATRRARVMSKSPDRIKQSLGRGLVELPDSLRY